MNENLRYTIPEVCIALTIFREELNVRVLSLFGMLLFSKFFHVVLDERMNYLEGGQGGGSAFSGWAHARLTALMWALALMNAQCLAVFGWMLSEQGHSVLILFAFEYCLLELEVLRVGYRYAIYSIGKRIASAGGAGGAGGPGPNEWANRSLYLLYGKLGMDVLKLAIYVLYFFILFNFYGMPIIMVRDLMRAYIDVQKEATNLLASRRLRSQMHRLFKTPTPADLMAHDPTCVVCTEDILPTEEELSRAKMLDCGHIFHISCLLLWWERQQICPTCRADINVMLEMAERRATMGSARGRVVPMRGAPPAPPPAEPARVQRAAVEASAARLASALRVHSRSSGAAVVEDAGLRHRRLGGGGGLGRPPARRARDESESESESEESHSTSESEESGESEVRQRRSQVARAPTTPAQEATGAASAAALLHQMYGPGGSQLGLMGSMYASPYRDYLMLQGQGGGADPAALMAMQQAMQAQQQQALFNQMMALQAQQQDQMHLWRQMLAAQGGQGSAPPTPVPAAVTLTSCAVPSPEAGGAAAPLTPAPAAAPEAAAPAEGEGAEGPSLR